MGRGDLSDAEWERLRPFPPASNRRCGRRRDHRQVTDGTLHRVRTGVQWRDLPERFGPWKTVYERHRLWPADGTWERPLQQRRVPASAGPRAKGVRRARTSGRNAVAELARPPGGGGAEGEGLGRSRGGFTTKLHLSADGRCRPLSLIVTPGQRADCTQFKPVLEKIRVPKPGLDSGGRGQRSAISGRKRGRCRTGM
ncbi:IS5 family transposase [Streptomyces sp. NBC_01450]|uniref:IS5 family transposase n=1 Tax=Streptomyces sp. NBC_01450 TaxID=2903871 RepID=UPI003FCCB33F